MCENFSKRPLKHESSASFGSLFHELSMYRLLSRLLVLTYPLWSWLLPDGYRLYRVDGGTIYLNIKESKMMFMRAVGLYEPNKHAAIKALIKPGSIFVDIGANKGDFSLLAAKMLGDSGSVIAIEPEPDNMGWLERSVRENGYDNISLHQFAISDLNGYAKLFIGSRSGWHTLVQGQAGRDRGEMEVETRRLDDIIHADSLGRPCMIKIDVEGAELSVLRGATHALSSCADMVLLIDIHPDMGVDPQEICSFLKNLDFEVYEEVAPFNIVLKDCRNATSIIARRPINNA